MKATLTKRQQEVLAYLKANADAPPTYREIAFHLGFSSPGNVADIIQRIVSRGWLEDPKGRARYWRFL